MPPHGSETTAAEGTAASSKADRKANDYWYEIWDKFTASNPKSAKKTSAATRKAKQGKQTKQPRDEEKDKNEKPAEDDSAPTAAFGSWEKAAADCRAKVAAIVKECTRLNQKYRDLVFNLDYQTECLQSLSCKFPADSEEVTPSGVSRIPDIYDSPRFSIDFGSPADVHQGMVGDCWFLSALTAVAAKRDLIDRLCVARNEEVGVYGFVFFRDGEWIPEIIDDKMLLRYADDDKIEIVRGYSRSKKEGVRIPADVDRLKDHLRQQGRRLYFSWSESQETWLPLIEKAYAKAHGDYKSIEGGWASEGIEDLTGGIATSFRPGDIMSKDRFWTEELMNVNKKYLFGGDSSLKSSKGMIDNHAYAVLQAYEEGDLRLLKLRNPWGHSEWTGDWSDGSKLWTSDMLTKIGHTFGDDGVFWMTYQDFFKHFRRISRVRLFDDSWKLSQLWTSVEVPWTVHCLDTKFQFTIDKTSSVVLALSQPDSRYFRGLKGRVYYALHFSVQREDDDEDEWIARSMHRSGGGSEYTRSVCAEVQDLEAGTYDVLITITATRYPDNPTAEEMVLKYAAGRKEKVFDVGRRLTYASEKGNRRAMELAMKRRREEEERDANIVTLKETRRTKQHERERARLRKLRIKAATGKPLEPFNKVLRKRQAAVASPAESQSSSEASDAEQETETVAVEDASESHSVGAHTPASEDDSRSSAASEETAAPSAASTDSAQKPEGSKDEAPKAGEAEADQEKESDVMTESTAEDKKEEEHKDDRGSVTEAANEEVMTAPEPSKSDAKPVANIVATETENANVSDATEKASTSEEQEQQQQSTEQGKSVEAKTETENKFEAETADESLATSKEGIDDNSESKSTADSSNESKTVEDQSSESRATEGQGVESKAAEKVGSVPKAGEEDKFEIRTKEDQPSESKSTEDDKTEATTKEDQKSEPKKSGGDTTAPKTTDEDKVESKTAEGGETESKTDEEGKIESKTTTEDQPSDSKPAEDKTAESKTDDAEEEKPEANSDEDASESKDGTRWFEEMLVTSKTKGTVVTDLSDEDFDWDSDIDGPIPLPDPSDLSDSSDSSSSDDDDSDSSDSDPEDDSMSARRRRRHRQRRARALTKAARGDIFPKDPWTAVCVVGLRVYSSTCEAKVNIIRGDGVDI